jgi:hypothetical protein
MRIMRIIGVLAVAAGCASVIGLGTATSAAGVPTTPVTPFLVTANALYVSDSPAPYVGVGCFSGQSSERSAKRLSIANVTYGTDNTTVRGNVANLVDARSSCSVSGEDNSSRGTNQLGQVSLVHDKLVLTGINVECQTDAAGNRTVHTSIGAVNGVPVGSTEQDFTIPGVAHLTLNQVDGFDIPDLESLMYGNAAVITVFPKTVDTDGHVVTVSPGYTVIIGHCLITSLLG